MSDAPQLHRAYIGMGSNLGDGLVTLREAWKRLAEHPGIELESLASPYKSAPVDMNSQHWFTNSVGCLRVSLKPLALLQVLLQVEQEFGRRRLAGGFGYQDRSLDLDLLYYDELQLDTPELVLPHPRIAERLFVLLPLCELAPELRDPVSGQSIRQQEESLRQRMDAGHCPRQELVQTSWP